jgi:ribosomal protein S27E
MLSGVIKGKTKGKGKSKMRECFDENAAKLSEVYWGILMGMIDDDNEDNVFNEVQIEKFYPCGSCGGVVYAPITFDVECPYCGEILQDN